MRRSCVRLAAGLALALTSPVPALGEPEAPFAIVALVLDTSGSIRPAALARTRDLALELLGALPSGSEVAVLTFDDASRVVAERTSQSEPVRQAIMAARASGRYTALHDAVYDASRYLRDAPLARKAIVLITDGKDENSALNLDDGLAVATQGGIPVFAIGLGRVEEKTLRRIAKLTSGEYLPIAEAKAGDLAARIASLPTPTPPPPSTLAASFAEAVPPAREAEPTTPASPWRGALWLLFVGAVLLAGLLILVGLSRRSARPAPSLLATADGPSLGAEPPELAAEEPPAEDEDPSYSPTMVGAMPLPEEYLDKTITLNELPTLVVQGGPQSGQFLVLMQNTTTCLGRARANDMVIDDVSASGQHCRIRFEKGQYVIHDLKSTNGTYVNEQRVTRQVLKAGDVLKLGETYVQFKMDRRKV